MTRRVGDSAIRFPRAEGPAELLLKAARSGERDDIEHATAQMRRALAREAPSGRAIAWALARRAGRRPGDVASELAHFVERNVVGRAVALGFDLIDQTPIREL